MQNVSYEEWNKYFKLKICSLEWNFGSQICRKFRWTSKSRFLVESFKIREHFNYSFFIKKSKENYSVALKVLPCSISVFDILFLAAYCFWFFEVCILEHYKWILFWRNCGKFLKIKFKRNFKKIFSENVCSFGWEFAHKLCIDYRNV